MVRFTYGSTNNLIQRYYTHFSLLAKDKHHCRHLQFAFNKYGVNNFIFDVIEIIPNFTREILMEREQYYMDIFKPQYNSNPKAERGLSAGHSEESRKKMSISHKGKTVSQETREKLSKIHKGVKKTLAHKNKVVESRRKVGYGEKPILQYDINGNFLQSWSSTKECSDTLNIEPSGISSVLRKINRSFKNFMFIYKIDPIPLKIPPRLYHNIVVQIDKNNNVVKEWKSAIEASTSLGVCDTLIRSCCRGAIKSAVGYYWKYKKDIEN